MCTPLQLIVSATDTVPFASLCPSVSFCFCFVSAPLPFSLDLSGFVFLTAFLLLCQCDRGRCKAVPVGCVDKTVDSALVGTVRVLAESKTLSFECVCSLCVWVFVCTVLKLEERSPHTAFCDIPQRGYSVRVGAHCRLRHWFEVFCLCAFFVFRLCVLLCWVVCVIKSGSWANELVCHVYRKVSNLFQAVAG